MPSSFVTPMYYCCVWNVAAAIKRRKTRSTICSLEITINPCDPFDARAYQTIISRRNSESSVVEVGPMEGREGPLGLNASGYFIYAKATR